MIIDQLLTIGNYIYAILRFTYTPTFYLCVLDSVAIVNQLGQCDCPLVSTRKVEIRY